MGKPQRIEDAMVSGSAPWVTDENVALFTDLYELTMLQAYWREGMECEAVFSLFSRKLPRSRNFLLACGLEDALHYLETVRFTDETISYLRTLPQFSGEFLDWLRNFRFTGDVYAVPEGTPVFADEPLLEVLAPLPEAQLAETFVLNQIHFQTVVASKAVRVVRAAAGRTVVDFGLRRIHGVDAGLKAARAFYIAGVDSTSNALAGMIYGIPVAGTMAHSYVQAFDDELEAFRVWTRLYPRTILLVDTYDTLEGVRRVVELAEELGSEFRVHGIRLDSGDLAELAFGAREVLDAAGLTQVEIFASGGLDEDEIAEIVARGAPITGFGVGTKMGVSGDAPALDMAYKLTEYAGRGRFKLSPGKRLLPGRKQVFRVEEGGEARRDIIGRPDEGLPGRPLLVKVMERGARIREGPTDLEELRARAREEIARLPARVQGLAPADPAYLVEVSARLRREAKAAMHGPAPE